MKKSKEVDIYINSRVLNKKELQNIDQIMKKLTATISNSTSTVAKKASKIILAQVIRKLNQFD